LMFQAFGLGAPATYRLKKVFVVCSGLWNHVK
jgi:hypothetical protein